MLLALVLAASPAPTLDVSRFCVETDGTVVVENDCGCNDALTCSATFSGKTVTVKLGRDEKRMPMCDDCFPMEKGRCALPAAAHGKVTVRAGTKKLELDLEHGKPHARACTK